MYKLKCGKGRDVKMRLWKKKKRGTTVDQYVSVLPEVAARPYEEEFWTWIYAMVITDYMFI